LDLMVEHDPAGARAARPIPVSEDYRHIMTGVAEGEDLPPDSDRFPTQRFLYFLVRTSDSTAGRYVLAPKSLYTQVLRLFGHPAVTTLSAALNGVSLARTSTRGSACGLTPRSTTPGSTVNAAS
jgi:hypothetical protein